MITTEVTIRFIEPSDGMVLRNKEDITIISKKVALSKNDDVSNWEEIDEATALLEKEQLEKEIEENLNILVENTVS